MVLLSSCFLPQAHLRLGIDCKHAVEIARTNRVRQGFSAIRIESLSNTSRKERIVCTFKTIVPNCHKLS